MTIIGFNFNKIQVTRNDGGSGKINVKNNVVLKDVVDHPLNLGGDGQKAVRFEFEFNSSYEPNLGSILLGGELVFIESKDKIKSLLDEWKKSRKVSKDIMTNVLNTVLTKCNIEALILSQKVNLPPPILLPRVNQGEQQSV